MKRNVKYVAALERRMRFIEQLIEHGRATDYEREEHVALGWALERLRAAERGAA